jgi:hypothetical protein
VIAATLIGLHFGVGRKDRGVGALDRLLSGPDGGCRGLGLLVGRQLRGCFRRRSVRILGRVLVGGESAGRAASCPDDSVIGGTSSAGVMLVMLLLMLLPS